MEPIGAGAQDDCAKFWMLVEKCWEKGKSDAVKGQDVFRFFYLFLGSPLIVPLWNGEALPLQNGHFPTHFINDKKVVQIQG